GATCRNFSAACAADVVVCLCLVGNDDLRLCEMVQSGRRYGTGKPFPGELHGFWRVALAGACRKAGSDLADMEGLDGALRCGWLCFAGFVLRGIIQYRFSSNGLFGGYDSREIGAAGSYVFYAG